MGRSTAKLGGRVRFSHAETMPSATSAARAADGGTGELSLGARRLLRFVGAHVNSSQISGLRAKQLPPPVATEHLDGGPEASLRAELAEYFAPFERRLAQ